MFEVGMLPFVLGYLGYDACVESEYERSGGEVAKYEALAIFGSKNAHNIAIWVQNVDWRTENDTYRHEFRKNPAHTAENHRE